MLKQSFLDRIQSGEQADNKAILRECRRQAKVDAKNIVKEVLYDTETFYDFLHAMYCHTARFKPQNVQGISFQEYLELGIYQFVEEFYARMVCDYFNQRSNTAPQEPNTPQS